MHCSPVHRQICQGVHCQATVAALVNTIPILRSGFTVYVFLMLAEDMLLGEDGRAVGTVLLQVLLFGVKLQSCPRSVHFGAFGTTVPILSPMVVLEMPLACLVRLEELLADVANKGGDSAGTVFGTHFDVFR